MAMDTRPSTDYHSPAVKAFNSANAGCVVDLSEASLIAEARRLTGLERFGDESFRSGLAALLASLAEDAQLNPFGRMTARGRVLRSLTNRLWANACFEAHPEIREQEIAAPIIIVGPHRSGTTRLQRLLAADNRLQHLTTWEGMNPAPRLGQPDLGRKERREEIVTLLQAGPQIYPGAFTAHPMEADWPEEEMLLFNHSFCSFSLLGLFHVPGYYRWFLAADKTDAYRDMANQMRLISWSRGDAGKRRWILKNPQHLLDLDVLMKVFPDAKLLFTHRDPVKTVGSVLSLMWCYAVQNTDVPCRGQVRDTWLDFCERLGRRGIALRDGISATQLLDVHYEEMSRDWRGTMRRVYAFAGLDFTPEAESALGTWLERSESENRHGGHRYSLAEFGTSPEAVDLRMGFLRERYGIPCEDHQQTGLS